MRTERRLPLVLLAAVLLAALPASAATITILVNDGVGEGFNDPTPAVPVGGNLGLTIGQQRLNVFNQVASDWGGRLSSAVTITIRAQFDPQFCDMSSAVLGSAGALTVHRDFVGAPFATTWYPQALANKLNGADLSGNPDINATFNSNLGQPGCGFTWYYGLDHNEGGATDLYAVVEHEIAHGLGFQTFVDTSTGIKFGASAPCPCDDTYMRNLEDHSLGMTWNNVAMSDAQRQASAIDSTDLHWVGAAVTAQTGLFVGGVANGHMRMYAPGTLQPGSSVSHWDTALNPNELMEPIITNNLSLIITDELMTDIGWGAVTPAELSSFTAE